MVIRNLSFAWLLHVLMLIQRSAVDGTVQLYSENLGGTPTNLIVDADQVYTSVKKIGVAFNLNLSASSRHQFTDSIHRDSAIAAMTKVPGQNKFIVCLYDESCHAVWPLTKHHNQIYASSHLKEIFFPEGSTLISEQTESDSVYFGGTRVDSNGSKWIHLGIIHFKSNNIDSKISSRVIESISRVINSVKITAKEFISRDFIYNFFSGDYCYFIARDNFVNNSKIKVLRVSRSKVPNGIRSEPIVEVQVHCYAHNKNFTIVSQTMMNQTIIIGLNQADLSILCTFSIADIDRAISATLSNCLTGNYEFSLPWSYMLLSCSDFIKIINSGIIASSTPVIGSNMMTFSGDKEIRAVTVVEIDQTHFYIYVACSGQKHVVEKYLIQDGTTSLKRLQPAVELSHPALLMRQGSALVYVATAKQIIGFEVDFCGKHTSCLDCVTSGDPVCGWCAPEGKCSRFRKCRPDNIWMGNSVQGGIRHCNAEKSQVISGSTMAMDNLHPLRLVTGVMSLSLPFNKEYDILCTSEYHKFVVQGFLSDSGSDIYCNFTNSNVPLSMRNKADALAKFTIVLKLDSVIVTFSNVAIHLHNCSMLFRCGECELVPVCGWCIYKNKCTGSSLHCLVEQNWIHKHGQGSTSVCPAVFPAKRGRYLLPVGVSTNISLLTRNVPHPSHNTRYLCKLQYSNGDFIYTSATYNNSFEVLCQIGTGQVVFSKAFQDKGMEYLDLTLWINGTSGLHEIDHLSSFSDDGTNSHLLAEDSSSSLLISSPPRSRSARMAVFNCSYYSESCSLCMTTNNAEFMCVWCIAGPQATCTALQSCSSTTSGISFINSSTRCYSQPIIKSVSPSSGPTAGGTLVAITGTDLGVNSNEIEVKFGHYNCSINHQSYQPARSLYCVSSPSASTGPASIVITVKRGTSTSTHFTSIFDVGVMDSFNYDTPYLHSIQPAYGPLNGGTLIVLHGSALNISNTDRTTVRIAESICNILNITYYKIYCVTSAVQSAMSNPVRLNIDHAYLQIKNFTYVENPEFYSLQPQHIIPAGGVILTITGNYLNVSVRPMLVIFIGNTSYFNRCVAVSLQLLLCTAPKLPLTSSQITSYTSAQNGNNKEALNYTIVMDRAPGPNISNQFLSLTLKEDPVFFEFDELGKQYEVFSGVNITILGRNLDSVHFSEIRVTLLEEPCHIIDITSMELICKPPDFPIRNDRDIEVKVSIANGSLIYKVGSLRYIKSTTETGDIGESPFSSMMFVVIVSCVGLSLVVLLMGLIIAVSIVTIRKYCRMLKVKQKIELQETKKETCLDKSNSDNWYEVISDSLVQSGHLFLEPDCNIANQPAHVSTNGAFEINRGVSQQLPAASAHGLSSICKEGIHGPPHLSEEYVRMCSHQICSNLSISTNIHKDKLQIPSDQSSLADYMDMQQVEQRPKQNIAVEPSYHHKNMEIVL